jgi:transcriptional regulator with XRE-family HTH domain
VATAKSATYTRLIACFRDLQRPTVLTSVPTWSAICRLDFSLFSIASRFTQGMTKFGELRVARGMSRTDVAKIAGVHLATISRIERGLQSPGIAMAAKLGRHSTQLLRFSFLPEAKMPTIADVHELPSRLWVFPLTPGSKRPLIGSNGFHDARPTHEWTKWPANANIGVAAGLTSRILVIDIDGQEGLREWAQICEDSDTCDVPNWFVRTRSGGMHIYYDIYGAFKSNAKQLAPHIDVRAEGGYVVAPPSVVETRKYEWILGPGFAVLRRPRSG